MIIRTLAAVLAALMLLAHPAAAQDSTRADQRSYEQVGEDTARVADAYFAAYIARDWDALEPLLAEGATFRDPTATHAFGNVHSEGRVAIMQRFRVGYASITHMEFASLRRLISGETAIYEGDLDWGLGMELGMVAESVAPMVIVLTVEGGRVTSHRDYLDYGPFLTAFEAAAEGSTPPSP